MREIPWLLTTLLTIPLWSCGGGDHSNAGETGGNGGVASNPFPRTCSDLYDPAIVPQFEIEMEPEQLALMEDDCQRKSKQYRPITFKYGSEVVSAMLRLKGNWSWRCDKKQFVVSFNETDPEGRFHGLRKLVLDAPWYDATLIAERVGMDFMRRQGSYWSCVNNAKVMLNGQYYGAYTNVERLDKEYLQRHFPSIEADGNLYEAGETLTTNESIADVSRRDALEAATGDLATIESLVDLAESVKMWAASAILPDPDSYWAGVEINYYLYDHPSRGFLFLPYDMDTTLMTGLPDSSSSTVDIQVNPRLVEADPLLYEHPEWKREPLLQTVLSDAKWCNSFLDAVRSSRAVYDVARMNQDIDTWSAQIASAVETDPNKPYSNDDHAAALAVMKQLLTARAQFIDNWLLTATCPVTQWPGN